jgi:hypothetical protein
VNEIHELANELTKNMPKSLDDADINELRAKLSKSGLSEKLVMHLDKQILQLLKQKAELTHK